MSAFELAILVDPAELLHICKVFMVFMVVFACIFAGSKLVCKIVGSCDDSAENLP